MEIMLSKSNQGVFLLHLAKNLFLLVKLLHVGLGRLKETICPQNFDLLPLKLPAGLTYCGVSSYRLFWISGSVEEISHFLVNYFISVLQMINVLCIKKFTLDIPL